MRSRLNSLRLKAAGLALVLLGGAWAAPAHAELICAEVLVELTAPANDAAAEARLDALQRIQSTLWIMQTYLRVMKSHPACANDTEKRREFGQTIQGMQETCRRIAKLLDASSYDCEQGQNFLGTAARTEAAIGKLLQASAGSGQNPQVKTCDEMVDRLREAAVDEAARNRLNEVQNRQSYVWAWQTYLLVMNRHPACDAGDREMQAEHVRGAQANCRASAKSSPAGSVDCEDGRNFWGTAARTEAAIRELLGESLGGAAAIGPAGGSALPR